MPYGLKRLLEIKAERQKRREEKDRIKTEKEKAKLEERKKARSKRLLKKRNARKYAKRKKALDEYRKLMGDEKGTFSIYLMKNGKRVKFFGRKRFKNAALELYFDLLKKNREEVAFKQTIVKNYGKYVENKYELVLVKKLSPEESNHVTLLRNNNGKFIENYLVDAPTHKILDKNEWFIEETFNVYGFDPQKERKDFNHIYDNIILKNTNAYSRLFVYRNKVIHYYDDENDFDMIRCKNSKQAVELYDTIEKKIDKKKYPNIFFMGKLSSTTSVEWAISEIQKKTGWTRNKCKAL
jgi:hypothetical protein